MTQHRSKRFGRHVASSALIGLLTLAAWPASAQTISDHNLAGAALDERGNCSILRIDFYSRVQLHSHFPEASGDELRINLKLIDRPIVTNDGKSPAEAEAARTGVKAGPRREQVRAPASERAAVGSIELESTGLEQVLSIYFRHAVAFRVAPGKDARTLLVAIAGRAPNGDCKPELATDAGAGAPSVPKIVGQHAPSAIETDIAEARAAMAKADHDRAIALLTRATEAGPGKVLPEALELLGVAREQKGHLAHARAEYQSYLKHFPKGDGHARVQRRLAALDKREQARPLPLAEAAAATSPSGAATSKLLTGGGGASAGPALRPSMTDDATAAAEPASAWRVHHSGSVSAYYNLNQGGRDFFVRPNQQNGWDKENVSRVYRNSVLGIGDYEGVASNPFYSAGFRVSASQEHRFTDDEDELRISTLTLESKLKEWGSSLRIGRQTHYGGGVLGRFDGGLATVPFADDWKLRVYGGAPVERAIDRPFLFDRAFYGASFDYAVSKRLDVGVFVIEQTTDQFVDRRAIGGEARYVDGMRHGFGSVDYDVHHGEINSVLGTGTVNFDDKSSLTGMLDFRRSPTMFTTNALQGQIETSLRDLLNRYTLSEIEDLARDRTPTSTFASISYSRYLGETLQATAELTVANMSSMPESGGVAATASTGWDTYTMLQLMATDVFKENDAVTGTVRFARAQSADRTMLEAAIRVPFGDTSWRVGPLLRVGYSDFKLDDAKEYLVHPMLRTSYNVSPNMQLEFEIGKRWNMRDTVRGRENETDLLLLSGLRYDFHTGR